MKDTTHCTYLVAILLPRPSQFSSSASVFVIDLQVAVKLVSGEVCDALVRLELRRIVCNLSDKGNFVSWRRGKQRRPSAFRFSSKSLCVVGLG